MLELNVKRHKAFDVVLILPLLLQNKKNEALFDWFVHTIMSWITWTWHMAHAQLECPACRNKHEASFLRAHKPHSHTFPIPQTLFPLAYQAHTVQVDTSFRPGVITTDVPVVNSTA